MKGSSGQPSSDAVHLGAILVLQLIEESLNFMGLESNATPPTLQMLSRSKEPGFN